MVRFRHIIHIVTYLALVGLAPLAAAGQPYVPQAGDLLFQEGAMGDFEQAIKAVTPAYKGKQLTHVGVVAMRNGRPYVIEAIVKGVVVTPYSEFLHREVAADGAPKVTVGRLKPAYRYAIPKGLARAQAHVGKPYDSAFDFENDRFYCSELIYQSLLDSLGKPIFTASPMTFNDPKTGALFGKWKSYFEELGIAIPEGRPGLNPGGMANEPVVDIIYSFY